MIHIFGWQVGQQVSIVTHDDTTPIDTQFFIYTDPSLPTVGSKEIANATTLKNYFKLSEAIQGSGNFNQNFVEGFARAVSLAILKGRDKNPGHGGTK